MVFNYLVKHNGVYYDPGENVPIEDEPVKVQASSPVVEVASKDEVKIEVEDKPIRKGGRPKKTEV